MRVPFGKKGLVAAGAAITGALRSARACTPPRGGRGPRVGGGDRRSRRWRARCRYDRRRRAVPRPSLRARSAPDRPVSALPAVGYVSTAMGTVSELRLPADREHILVAKRAAACHRIARRVRHGRHRRPHHRGAHRRARTPSAASRHPDRSPARSASSSSWARMGLEVRRAQHGQSRGRAPGARRAGRPRASADLVAATDLALRLMGLFVDDSTYRVDGARTGTCASG